MNRLFLMVNAHFTCLVSCVLLFGAANAQVNPIDSLLKSMVMVEGGTFQMGNQDADAEKNEKPAHNVLVNTFKIGKYEVTQAQWVAVMGTNPSFFSNCDDCPVELVDWNLVQEFIRKLNDKTGASFRLPTEAEWEYAARGGNKSKSTKYSGGNDINQVAWYSDGIAENRSHPVGKKKPNELGLYDMSGNVWEWCSDRYAADYYAKSPAKNPQGPDAGEKRVVRGGSWNCIDLYCGVSYRWFAPSDRNGSNGLRLVQDVK